MKRRIILLLAFAALLSSLMAAFPISAKAESGGSLSFPSGITLYSPLNMTYDSRYLTLNLTLYSAGNMGSIDPQISMTYSVDGKYNGSVPLEVSNPGLHVVTNAAGFVTLPKLSEGSHCLTIYLFGHNQKTYDPKYLSYVDTVYFSISADASDVPPPGWVPQDVTPQNVQPQDLTPPKISILSPTKNQSYETTNITSFRVPLNFTVDETSQLSFSLDGQLNTTINWNSSLVELPAGLHNVTVYALDSAGNVGASETVNFSITIIMKPEPESEHLVLPFAVSGASVAGIAVAGVVYAKRRKR